MSVPLIEISRGQVVESVHRGDVAVVSHEGELLFSAGNPRKTTYFRSAAKPIQALNVFLSGAAAAFDLSDDEVAVTCASHYAEPHHIKTIEKILKKTGLSPDHILGGIVPPLRHEYALQVAREGVELTPLFSDCSGKHCGFLTVCRHKEYPLTNYLQPEHPMQQEILKIIALMSVMDPEKIAIGIDGCSAPVHALPIYNMALAYARLATPVNLPVDYALAAEKTFRAMNRYPEMISGSGGFCSELIRHTHSKLIGKVGAEGVYCVGLRKEKLGIAIKIESGATTVLPPVAMHVLKRLDVLDAAESEKLDCFTVMNNVNDVKTVVGKIRPVFDLVVH